MEHKELKEIISNIKKALRSGNYTVDFDDPNCIWECMAPDGRTFYKFTDMDSAKTSSDFGSCIVNVAGYTFTCDLGTGDIDTDFPDDVSEDLLDAFNNRHDIIFCECTDMDWCMTWYAKEHGIKNPEYYWEGDDDCPVDISDRWITYEAPADLDYGTVYFAHRKYYLVEEPNDGKVHAVHCSARPDDQGIFPTVILDISIKKGKIKVTGCEESQSSYYATERCVMD